MAFLIKKNNIFHPSKQHLLQYVLNNWQLESGYKRLQPRHQRCAKEEVGGVETEKVHNI